MPFSEFKWMQYVVLAFFIVSFFIAYMTARRTDAKNAFPPIGIVATALRIFIVVLCYWFSGVGIFASMIVVNGVLQNPNANFIEYIWIFVWTCAWLCHAVMCCAWISNWRLMKFWPLSGAIFGTASFLFIPIGGAIQKKNMEFMYMAKGMSGVLFLELLLILPCFLLALYLTFFHLRNKAAKNWNGLLPLVVLMPFWFPLPGINLFSPRKNSPLSNYILGL